MADRHIGARIKALRQERGISQNGLASLLGFKDRQTVSAIETGVRRVTVTELLLTVEKLNVPLDYFTDPFRLDGEGLFSWRQSGISRSDLTTIRLRSSSSSCLDGFRGGGGEQFQFGIVMPT